MLTSALTVHRGLQQSARFRPLSQARSEPSAAEWLVLLVAGAAAGCAVVLLNGWKLGIPGHAILRAVLPITVGLALVPRRWSGSIMGFAACATGLGFLSSGAFSIPVPALAAATAFGPVLDLALEVRSRWHAYLAAISAGIAANLLGLGAKAVTVWMGTDAFNGKLPLSMFTYILCGALAGALSAALCFRASGSRGDSP